MDICGPDIGAFGWPQSGDQLVGLYFCFVSIPGKWSGLMTDQFQPRAPVWKLELSTTKRNYNLSNSSPQSGHRLSCASNWTAVRIAAQGVIQVQQLLAPERFRLDLATGSTRLTPSRPSHL